MQLHPCLIVIRVPFLYFVKCTGCSKKSDFITGHEPILCIVMRAYCQNVYEDSFKREILLQQAREASNEYLKAATLL